MTEIIKEDNPEKAASVLKRGGVIIYPTETLYGMGALAQNERAVEKIFDIKGRPEGKPIPILVRDKTMLDEFAEVTDEGYLSVAESTFGAKVPSPLFSSTLTVLLS